MLNVVVGRVEVCEIECVVDCLGMNTEHYEMHSLHLLFAEMYERLFSSTNR